ncbi:MAG: enolase C-terminal domain-like protein [Bacteroidia bacterium]
MKLNLTRASLPFHIPFTISGGRTKSEQETLIVMLEKDGFQGFGEAPAIRYYQISLDYLMGKAVSKSSEIEAFNDSSPYAFNELLNNLFPEDSFLRCALDTAFWDLQARINGTSAAGLAGLPLPASVSCDYTIGIDSAATMLQKMNNLPWPVYKIKVGFEGDSELFNMLCRQSNAQFRLDANAAWTVNEANSFLNTVDISRIEFTEQPLKRELFAEMKSLQSNSSMLFIADEDFRTIEDLDRCEGRFGGINIKLTKCGGITPALQIAEEARKRGFKIMLGNMNESTLGTWALLQVCSMADFIDADGPLLLKGDYASGLEYRDGKFLSCRGRKALLRVPDY